MRLSLKSYRNHASTIGGRKILRMSSLKPSVLPRNEKLQRLWTMIWAKILPLSIYRMTSRLVQVSQKTGEALTRLFSTEERKRTTTPRNSPKWKGFHLKPRHLRSWRNMPPLMKEQNWLRSRVSWRKHLLAPIRVRLLLHLPRRDLVHRWPRPRMLQMLWCEGTWWTSASLEICSWPPISLSLCPKAYWRSKTWIKSDSIGTRIDSLHLKKIVREI